MYNKVNKFKKHGLGHAFLDVVMIDLASISELLSKPVQEKKKKNFSHHGLYLTYTDILLSK